MRFISATGIVLFLTCAPSRDTVLKDVERNYTGTGFLDPDTFQIPCLLADDDGESAPAADRLAACKTKLIAEMVLYKEKYDREAFARRMHQDFLPFLKAAEVTDAAREKWRVFFTGLAEKHTRIVFEKRNGEAVEGVYRLRLKDLIYRVQRVE